MSELDGRVAIVTGAGSGIGRETAHQLAAAGARVMIADIDGPAADEVRAEIVGSVGGIADSAEVDVSDDAQVRTMVAQVVETWGRLDVLDNNAATAGHVTAGDDLDITEMSLEVWDHVMGVNLRGAMLCCRHAIPVMRAGDGGSIVNISSVAGLAGQTVHPAYGTAKGGLNALTRYVATSYGRDGIRCNAIAPGVIRTPALDANVPDDVVDIYRAHTLVDRLGSPADIAALCVLLASDRGGFITGQVIAVDGGLLAHVPQYADLERRAAERAD